MVDLKASEYRKIEILVPEHQYEWLHDHAATKGQTVEEFAFRSVTEIMCQEIKDKVIERALE